MGVSGSAALRRAPSRRSCCGLRKLNSSETAIASTRCAFSVAISPSISLSASGTTIEPSAPMRSVISNRRRRGISVAGASWKRS